MMDVYRLMLSLVIITSICGIFEARITSLTDGIEHIIQLAAGKFTKLQFEIPSGQKSVWMYITPCGINVHWQLYWSHEMLNYGPLNTVLQAKDKFNHIEPEGESLKMYNKPTKAVLIAEKTDNKRMTFFSDEIRDGSLTLLLASEEHGNVRVFITSRKFVLEDHYPMLPSNTTVSYEVLKNGHNDFNDGRTVRMHWNALDRMIMLNTTDSNLSLYRFCAVVSRGKPDWTICDELGENLESIHCVNQSIGYIDIDNIRIDRRYFVTVFIRNVMSGSTSALEPLEIYIQHIQRPKAKKEFVEKWSSNTHELLNARLQAGKLSPFRGAIQNFDFDLRHGDKSDTHKVLLVLHACDGYIRVAIYRNGRLLRRSDPFSGFRRFLVMNAFSGHLTFQIINDDSKPKIFRLWASTKPEKSPYPQLPDNTSIKEIQRNCSSTTLQWMRASDDSIRYCLYRRMETVHFLEELVNEHTNLCSEKLPQSHLVDCYDYINGTFSQLSNQSLITEINLNIAYGSEDSDSTSTIIETTINDLQPDVTYRFDLLAQPLRAGGQELPYRTVWVKTRAFC